MQWNTQKLELNGLLVRIEPYKAWHKVTNWDSFINFPYALIGHLSIHAHITCIVYNLGALGVAQNIQVMGSL